MQCDVEDSSPERNCVICKELASGTFFGATVCLPCKSFFIRCTRDGDPDFVCQFSGTCDVTYANRSSCQACRYQKCLAVGMKRKERPEQVEPIAGQELCSVCSDISNGIHFGVPTCEGCKKFFRRGLKESSTYLCRGNKLCQINPRNRNSCRFCRFKKCLFVGMSREAVRMGRPRKDTSAFGFRNPELGSPVKYFMPYVTFNPAAPQPGYRVNCQYVQPQPNVGPTGAVSDANLSTNTGHADPDEGDGHMTVEDNEKESYVMQQCSHYSVRLNGHLKEVILCSENNDEQLRQGVSAQPDVHSTCSTLTCSNQELCLCKTCCLVASGSQLQKCDRVNTQSELKLNHSFEESQELKGNTGKLHTVSESQELSAGVPSPRFDSSSGEPTRRHLTSNIQDICAQMNPVMDEQLLLKINTTFSSYFELVKSDHMWRQFSHIQRIICENQINNVALDVNDVLFSIIQRFPDIVDYWHEAELVNVENDMLSITDKEEIEKLTKSLNCIIKNIHDTDRQASEGASSLTIPWEESTTGSKMYRIPTFAWPWCLSKILGMNEGGIEFATSIPGFSSIEEKDQYMLVRQATMMMVTLVGSCLLYDEEHHEFAVFWKWPMHPTVPFYYGQQETWALGEELQALGLTKEEVALLAALCFTVKVNEKFSDAEKIRKVWHHIMRLLCLQVKGNEGGVERLKRAMKLLPRVTLLAEWLVKLETCFRLPIKESTVSCLSDLVANALHLTECQ